MIEAEESEKVRRWKGLEVDRDRFNRNSRTPSLINSTADINFAAPQIV